MGIPGLWDTVNRELDPKPTTLAKASNKFFGEHGRPLRVAVDASILVWKYAASTKGATFSAFALIRHHLNIADLVADGMNHATKNFMDHVCHVLEAGVQAVYVFDGPGRPQVKRDTVRPNIGPPRSYVPPAAVCNRTQRDIDAEHDFGHITALSKQLLMQMGVDSHDAPGEAEAECVALEAAGLIDAVATTDGDALAFGGKCILRYKNKAKGCKTRMVDLMEMITSESLVKVKANENRKGLNRGNWILLALISGGDYGHGLHGCGATTANRILEIARSTPQDGKTDLLQTVKKNAVKSLCDILNVKGNTEANLKICRAQLKMWRSSQHSRFVEQVREISVAARIPDDFPDAAVVDLYVGPRVSSAQQLTALEGKLWTLKPLIQELRDYTAGIFAWHGRDRAKQFMNRLTPAFLAKQLLMAGCSGEELSGPIDEARAKIQKGQDSGKISMVKVSYKPLEVTPLDYESEAVNPDNPWAPGSGDKKDPKRPYEAELPEFLVRFGAPSALTKAGNATGQRKRPNKSAVSPRQSKKAMLMQPDDSLEKTALSIQAGGPRVAESANQKSKERVAQESAPSSPTTSSTRTRGFQKMKLPAGYTSVSSLPAETNRKDKEQAVHDAATPLLMDRKNPTPAPLINRHQRLGVSLSEVNSNSGSGTSAAEPIDMTKDD